MSSYLLALAALAASAVAFPKIAASTVSSAVDPRFTQFVAPGPGDVRSPCPGLNALANHGFIHRNGKNMTIDHLNAGLSAGMNMGADFTLLIGGAGLLSAPIPLLGYFDLDWLDEHNFPIEHDSSLSRQDAYFGNDYSFYQPNFDTVLSHFGTDKYTSLQTAADAKFARYNNSLHINPQFTYGIREFIFTWGETAIYLQAMSDPYSGKANVDYVKMLFEQEKLPYELGWRPSPQPVTIETLGQMVFELYGKSKEPLPEGFNLTVNSYKDALVAVQRAGLLAGNLTSIIGL